MAKAKVQTKPESFADSGSDWFRRGPESQNVPAPLGHPRPSSAPSYAPTAHASRSNPTGRRSESMGPEPGHRAALAVFALGVFFVAFVVFQTVASRSTARHARAPNPDAFADRAARAKAQIELKLQTDRAIAAIEAKTPHLPVPNGSPEPLPDVVTMGLPLATQPYHLSKAELEHLDRKSEWVADRGESTVRGLVKDDRDSQLWEIKARRMYVADFIANARAAGWAVQIDRDLNVIYERLPGFDPEDEFPSRGLVRMPQSQAAAKPSRSFSFPLFAPICPNIR